MSTEMLILVVLGIQTTLILGTIGLVAMGHNSRMAAIQSDQREIRADQREIRSDIKELAAQQHQDYKDLSAKIDQVLMTLKSREPA